jgi:predicted transcriptional regulator of viral defense system
MYDNATKVNKNLLTLAQLRDIGYSPTSVSKAVKRGELTRVAHGTYLPSECASHIDDEMYHFQLRYNQIIYSHDTALYLHGLNDRDPLKYSVTVPTGYNTKRLNMLGFNVFSLKKALYNQDITEVVTMFGNNVKLYNLERTICDCLRSRSRLQTEIVMTGLKRYVRRNDRNLSLLAETAEKLHVFSLLKTHLEVLL